MPDIELEAKSDRELLILAVQKINEINYHLMTLNGSVSENEKAITCQKTNLASLPCRILGKYYWIAIILVLVSAIAASGDFALRLFGN